MDGFMGEEDVAGVGPLLLAEEVPDSSPMVSAQQSLESTGDGTLTRRARHARRRRRNRQMKREHAKVLAGEPILSRKDEMRQKRLAEAVGDAVTVPVELDDLSLSQKPRHKPRVYRHEELARLGVRTIQWSGVYTLFLLLGFVPLTQFQTSYSNQDAVGHRHRSSCRTSTWTCLGCTYEVLGRRLRCCRKLDDVSDRRKPSPSWRLPSNKHWGFTRWRLPGTCSIPEFQRGLEADFLLAPRRARY